jgi:hypothetical protein
MHSVIDTLQNVLTRVMMLGGGVEATPAGPRPGRAAACHHERSFGDLTGLGTSAARITAMRRPEYA